MMLINELKKLSQSSDVSSQLLIADIPDVPKYQRLMMYNIQKKDNIDTDNIDVDNIDTDNIDTDNIDTDYIDTDNIDTDLYRYI